MLPSLKVSGRPYEIKITTPARQTFYVESVEEGTLFISISIIAILFQLLQVFLADFLTTSINVPIKNCKH